MDQYKWKSQNDKILTRNGKISTCCCGDTDTLFWSMVPCDALITYGTVCYNPDVCVYTDRRYVEIGAYSEASHESVCECQQLYLYGITDQIYTTQQTNAIQVAYSGGGTASLDWQTTQVVVIDSGGTHTILFDDLTLQEVLDEINAIGTGFWSTSIIITLDGNQSPLVINPETLSYTGSATKYLDTVTTSTFKLTWRGETTADITFSTTGSTLATNIQNALNALSFGLVFTVSYSSQSDYNQGYFDIKIGGEFCGAPQPNIEFAENKLIYQNNSSFTHWNYPDRLCNWGDVSENYRVFGKSDYCPYEDNTGIGPAIFATGVQCCPQRGTIVNSPQNIDLEVTGYRKGSNWNNLETTVTVDGTCFGVRPPWFILGKEGRLRIDPSNYAFRPYEVGANVWATPTGLGDLSCNCTPELFVALFHPNVPWGPFGSYYPDIEVAEHPAWTTYAGTSYFVDSGFIARYGWDYRPTAEIKTQGTWLETTGIRLSFNVNHPCPFYVGGDYVFDDRTQSKLDIPTVPSASGWTILQHAVTGAPHILQYNPSGRTIKDFVDSVNAIRIRGSGDQKCQVFSFCIASNSVTGVPCKFIVNTTSDIWDLGKNNADNAQNDWQNIYHPILDTRIKSGANVLMGTKSYWDMYQELLPSQCYTENPTGFLPGFLGDKPYIYNQDPGVLIETDITKIYAELPPPCRTSRNIPKEYSNVIAEAYRDTPWFTAIQGCNTNVLNIQLGPSGLSDSFDDFKYTVLNRKITINAYQGGVVVRSGIFDTNKSGSGYTLRDLASGINNFRWTGVLHTPLTYKPFIATGIFSNFDIWLDDHTWQDSVTAKPVNPFTGGAIRTTTNYAFVEPLLDGGSGVSFNNSFNLSTYIRRRCEHYDPITTLYNNDFRLKHCLPADAMTYSSGNTIIDLEGDEYVDDGWLISYGCNSYVCKTEWYIKASRCPCDTVYRCTNGLGQTGGYVKHPYNREGDELDNGYHYNQGYDPCNNLAVNQPDFYICDNNLHPNCEIPMLVKVPYQVIDVNNIDSCDGIYYVYYDNQPDDFGCNLDWMFCSDEDNGWCQYINPESLERVSKQNIPRTWPPTAYIAERSNVPLCSSNPFYYPVDEWCNCDMPSTDPCGWDQICGIYPAVPPEYIGDYGYACNVPTLSEVSQLCVHFRPYIKNLTVGELCGGDAIAARAAGDACSLLPACYRIDIDCGTKCCECFWNCSDDECANNLVRNPCSRTFNWDSLYTITNGVTDCGWFGQAGGGPGSCNYGCCLQGAATFLRGLRLGVTYNYSESHNFTYHQHTCGCLGVDGEYNKSYEIVGTDCPGPDYYDPCEASPTPTDPSQPVCGNRAGELLCGGIDSGPISCEQFEFQYFDNNGSFGSCDTSVNCNTTGLTLGRACGTTCGGSYGCAGGFTEIYRNDCNTGEFDICGEGTQTCEYSIRTKANGVSIYDGCFPGDHTLRFEDGSNGDILEEYTVTKTISPQSCGACPNGTVPTVTWATVSGWRNDFSKWLCGYANDKVSTVINSGYVYP